MTFQQPARLAAPAPLRTHPLATVSIITSAMGFVPLIIVGGLVGSAMGAIASVLIRRQPERWGGAAVADAGVAVGLLTGVVMLAIFGVVRADDWGWGPLVATIAYGTLIAGVAGYSHGGRRGALVGAGIGAGSVVAIVAAVVGTVVLILVALGAAVESLAEG